MDNKNKRIAIRYNKELGVYEITRGGVYTGIRTYNKAEARRILEANKRVMAKRKARRDKAMRNK